MNRDTKIWINRRGQKIPIESMSLAYLRNCLSFFKRMLNDGAVRGNEVNFRLLQVRLELQRRGEYE